MKTIEAKRMIKQLMTKNHVHGWKAYLAHNEIDAGATFYDYHIIEFYTPFFTNNSKRVCKDTVLHEIAHVLACGDNSHGEEWKKECVKIGAVPEEFLNAENFPEMVYPREMTHEECLNDPRGIPLLPEDLTEVIHIKGEYSV